MNICFIGKHTYPSDALSNEQDMKTWRSLIKYFNHLLVIAESPNLFFHSVKDENITILLLPRLGYPIFAFIAVFVGLWLNLRYGINVYDASEVGGGGIAATLLKFLTGRPSVIEVQGEVFKRPEQKENFKSRLLKKIGKWAMDNAARVRVISHAIYSQIKERGINEAKIKLVSLRVDLADFNPEKFKTETDKRPIVGYIGRITDGKGLEDLFEAVTKLKNQYTGFKVFIFGKGSLEEKLKQIAAEFKIENNIEWRGFVSYSKVPQALSEIDIFVYPSWHEGFGRSIMEALAMEKAVVATRVGGIPDLIKDGENGFLVAPHNSDELAQKIKILIEDKELRKKFGKAGREWVKKNFEWNEGIKKFAELFLELK